MICGNCGAPVQPDAAFCSRCGRSLGPPKPRLPLRAADRGFAISTLVLAPVILFTAYLSLASSAFFFMRSSIVARSGIVLGTLAFLCFLTSASLGIAGAIVCLCKRRAAGFLLAAGIVQTVGFALRAPVILKSLAAFNEGWITSERELASMMCGVGVADWWFQLAFYIVVWVFVRGQKKRFAFRVRPAVGGLRI